MSDLGGRVGEVSITIIDGPVLIVAPYDTVITSKRDEPSAPEKRKKTPTGSTKRVLDATKTKSGRPRKPALLIKNLGGSDKKKGK